MKAVVILLLGALALPAAGMTVAGDCQIRFYGSSTFKDFSGSATSHTFRVDVPADATNLNQVSSLDVLVSVSDMDTGNGLMNRKMYAMLQADSFPLVKGGLTSPPPPPAAGGVEAGSTPSGHAIALTIRDVTLNVPVTVSHIDRRADRASFDLDFSVSLDAFGLKAPTFMKFMRVHDAVRVHVAVSLWRMPDAEASAPAPGE